VDVNYSYIYLVNYSCSLQCIEKIYLTKVILVVGVLKERASRFYRFLVLSLWSNCQPLHSDLGVFSLSYGSLGLFQISSPSLFELHIQSL
jgi:hypothetical protein